MRGAWLLAAALCSIPAEAAQWPEVLPLKQTFRIESWPNPVSIEVPILTRSGTAAYAFTCRSDPEDPRSEGVPSFLCILNEKPGWIESSLLGEDDAAVWFSRGQYHVDELLGECASYPEYGAHRTFRLRGFRLELTATGIKSTAPGRVESLELTMAIRPDPSARQEHAARPGYLPPKFGKCRPIRKGNEPRMCREWPAGTWMECRKLGR
jgi:hypothetical protein